MNTIGLLHDHLLFCEFEQIPPEDLSKVVHRFLVNRLRGTIDEDGSDPTGLFWTKVRRATVKRDRSHLRTYSDFCGRHYEYFPLLPKCEPVRLITKDPAFISLAGQFIGRLPEVTRGRRRIRWP